MRHDFMFNVTQGNRLLVEAVLNTICVALTLPLARGILEMNLFLLFSFTSTTQVLIVSLEETHFT